MLPVACFRPRSRCSRCSSESLRRHFPGLPTPLHKDRMSHWSGSQAPTDILQLLLYYHSRLLPKGNHVHLLCILSFRSDSSWGPGGWGNDHTVVSCGWQSLLCRHPNRASKGRGGRFIRGVLGRACKALVSTIISPGTMMRSVHDHSRYCDHNQVPQHSCTSTSVSVIWRRTVRCAKSRLFTATSGRGSQGPEFCTLQPLLVHLVFL